MMKLSRRNWGLLLLAVGVALELAYSRVTSGASGADSNSLASFEGQLSNLNVLTGSTARIGLLAFVGGVYLAFF